jgi:hypothetical protein
MTPPSALATRHTRTHDHSTVLTLGRNRRDRVQPSEPALTGQARRIDPTSTEGTTLILVQSDAIPAPCSRDKTTTPSGDGQYGDPPSKYSLIRPMYDSTHHGMRSTTMALT